ncbi:small acid-soluble spore protein K [Aquibacillus albus]|uniref:Small acid-soluble spore protein K (Minor) n=1 Tax=Aquibacillus albus TaxID=1168171 RepID=A0ABS2N2V9_9BACI|nr:small acid-soluble spore protein K [Aquibacillus albus]MBM7572465.1 small acid-soluble spore protein K (minor) [Aquibacillus albus]
MRNKKYGFTDQKMEGGEARAKAAYSSKRADGTINTDPQGRMKKSSNR